MKPIVGSIVALVTPMREDGSVDFDALRALIDWHIAEGTDCLAPCGTTGESPTLDHEEHERHGLGEGDHHLADRDLHEARGVVHGLLREAGREGGLQALFEAHPVEVLAIEAAFVHENPHTALALGQARGLPIALAAGAATIVQAATSFVLSQILGVADKLGSLEVGKLATLFVADGDPLEPSTRIERVFMQGREVELTDRQTALRDKYLKRQ